MNERSAPSTRRTPTFAAVIAHADDAEMLRRCVAHHLRIGVDYIFVSLNLDDAPSAAAAAELAAGNVRAARLATFAADPFDYFTAALRALTDWVTPDWVLFVDSDEFWIPAAGDLAHTADLERYDAFSVRRFNAPPVRCRDGTIHNCNAVDAATTILIRARRTLDAEELARCPETPWLYAQIGPKLMVRPELVDTIGVGAHDFVPRGADPRTVTPRDLLIVHLPFTTEARFRRKIDAIRVMLATHAERYQGSLAWHWRRWVAIEEAGGAHAEFMAQLVDEATVADLFARGVLTTPAVLLTQDQTLRA